MIRFKIKRERKSRCEGKGNRMQVYERKIKYRVDARNWATDIERTQATGYAFCISFSRSLFQFNRLLSLLVLLLAISILASSLTLTRLYLKSKLNSIATLEITPEFVASFENIFIHDLYLRLKVIIKRQR